MALLHDYLKHQPSQNDVWTIREQLCLVSAVAKTGDQNWVAVSRICRSLTSEINRPPDWYSNKNCAYQYGNLLEMVDTPNRKREKGDSTTSETPCEIVGKFLATKRIEELRELVANQKQNYEKLVAHINLLESGQMDHRIDQVWEQTVQEQRKVEDEERLQEEWLKLRSERILSMQKSNKAPLLKDTQSKQPPKDATGSLEDEQTVASESHATSASLEPANRKEDAVTENQNITIKVELPDIEEADISQEEMKSQLPPHDLEVPNFIFKEADMNLTATQSLFAGDQKDDLYQDEKEDLPVTSKVSDETPQEFVKLEPTEPLHVHTHAEPVAVTSDEGSKSNADDIYAFDSDPESSDKKGIPSFSLSRDDPKKPDKYEKFKSSRKRKRTFKDSQDELFEKDNSAETLGKADHEEFELPKKVRRSHKKDDSISTKRDDDDRKKLADVDDDDVSRDSAEVKEILMFVKSDRRRVYGHDDTASPVISESTPSSPASTYYGDDSESEKLYKTWKKSIMLVWNDIAAHKNASIFLRPISQDKLPGYHSIVYKPTDLHTIKRQIETAVIRTTAEFKREMMILFLNAKMYNPKDHNVYLMAQEMMKDCITTIEEFQNAQVLAKSMDTPQKSLRRETRESSAKRSDLGVKRKRK